MELLELGTLEGMLKAPVSERRMDHDWEEGPKISIACDVSARSSSPLLMRCSLTRRSAAKISRGMAYLRECRRRRRRRRRLDRR